MENIIGYMKYSNEWIRLRQEGDMVISERQLSPTEWKIIRMTSTKFLMNDAR